MTISDRISKEELVQMYEFCASQLVKSQEENQKIRDALQKISKYESNNDDAFDFKMVKVIASVALLN